MVKNGRIIYFFTFILFICFLHIFSIKIYAADNGYCGVGDNYENVTWRYDSNSKTLTFSGNGAIDKKDSFPWTKYKSVTKKIVIEDGITSIPSEAFQFFMATEAELGNAVTSLGEYSFYSSNIEFIRIPGSVKRINNGAFGSCNNLEFVILEEGVEAIGVDSFSSVGKTENASTVYYLPSTISTIDPKAFGSITREVAVVYGKNDYSKDFFDNLEPTYVDVTTALDLSKVEGNFDENYYEYTGNAITPSPIITYKVDETHTVTLHEGFDYSLTYKDNINRGMATVTLTGMSVYTGKKDITFKIATSLSECNAVLSKKSVIYDGKPQTPSVNITNGNYELVENVDYTLKYKDNIDEGEASVIITGIGNYKNEITLLFNISKIYFYGNIDCVPEYERVLFDGTEKCPSYTVTCEGKVLEANKDYTLTYKNNVDEGIAQVTVTGIGSYGGIFASSFEIFKYDLDDENATLELEYNNILYDGTEKKPAVIVKYGDVVIDSNNYDVSYTNNTEEGMATVTVTGKNSCKGEKTADFSIFKNDIAGAEIGLEYDTILYDGNAKTPKVSVKFENKELEEGKDYSVAYSDHIEMGTANVMVSGIGSFKGTVGKSFSIYKYNLKDVKVEADKTSYIYDGTSHTPVITATYNEKVLKADTDYKLTIKNEIEAGQYIAVIEGIGQYTGTRELEYVIEPIVIDDADVRLKDTIFTYDGSPKKPTTTVALAGKTLVENQDYKLSYKNNIDEGTAYAVIEGINNYSGHIEVSFKILAYQSGMDAVYKEDDTLMDDDYVYHIIDVDSKEVEFTAPADNKETEVVVPATITTANGDVFTVTSIGEKAFYKNTKIKKLTVANTVKSIENYAFYGCKNLTTIKIGNGIEIVGDSAFRKCTKLTAIVLPKSLNHLGKNTFYGCSRLKNITINANIVIDIKANAIKGISKKAVIKVPGKLVKKYKKEFDKKSGFKGGMKVKKK